MKSINPHQDLLTLEPFRVPKDLDGEKWLDIEGYEGLYRVSNLGRVKSFKKFPEGRILKPALNLRGYSHVTLVIGGKKKQCLIHRLVATAFIPNPRNKPDINHVNGIKTDNRVENLEWATAAENCRHAVDMGLKPQGEDCYQAKLTNADAFYIRENPDNLTCKELAAQFGISESAISPLQLGKTYKSAGGKIHKARHRSPNVPIGIRKEIRKLYVKDSRDFGIDALARQFEVNRSTVWKIIHETD